MKYLFITGGVLSSLGKGLTAAAIGMLLEARGLKVALMKLDPYLNVDPGTMNPFQHGEVYVTDDGAETDLDLGHYYRYTHSPLSRASNATSGQIYDTVIRRERKGDYLGKTVQVIPHVTDEIKARIQIAARQAPDLDVLLVEIGGTVGDIESLPFLEGIRQFRTDNPHDCLNLHLTYVPYLKAAGEVKTKPTQHSVQSLRQIGIIPDMILCRCEEPLSAEIKEKIALFCSVAKTAVFDEPDVKRSIYEVPLQLHEQGADAFLCERLNLPAKKTNLADWEKMLHTLFHPKGKVTIGIVGKYLDHQDAYKSVFEALHHAATACHLSLELKRFESDQLTDPKVLASCDGIVVPGGFGERGWEGKLRAAQYCRTHKIPYLGLCLGLQVLITEYARNVLNLKDANSTEMNPKTPHPVISLLEEQQRVVDKGGTMRLGAFICTLRDKTRAQKAYGAPQVSERHRHRYEFNNAYKADLEAAGLIFSGVYERGDLCEIAEIKDHPWMLGVQFHPEFKSKPLEPHPLFKAFIDHAHRSR